MIIQNHRRRSSFDGFSALFVDLRLTLATKEGLLILGYQTDRTSRTISSNTGSSSCLRFKPIWQWPSSQGISLTWLETSSGRFSFFWTKSVIGSRDSEGLWQLRPSSNCSRTPNFVPFGSVWLRSSRFTTGIFNSVNFAGIRLRALRVWRRLDTFWFSTIPTKGRPHVTSCIVCPICSCVLKIKF